MNQRNIRLLRVDFLDIISGVVPLSNLGYLKNLIIETAHDKPELYRTL